MTKRHYRGFKERLERDTWIHFNSISSVAKIYSYGLLRKNTKLCSSLNLVSVLSLFPMSQSPLCNSHNLFQMDFVAYEPSNKTFGAKAIHSTWSLGKDTSFFITRTGI